MDTNIDNVTLTSAQSKLGIKAAIKQRNKEFQKRNIITKDILVPVKDKDGNIVKDKDGNIVKRWVTIPTYIPEVEKEAIKVFIDSYPCWFAGCEELRKKYKDELNSENPNGCSSCKKAPILRKYLKLAVNALNSLKDAST